MKLSEIKIDELKMLTIKQKTQILYGKDIPYAETADIAFILGADPTRAKLRAELAAEYYFNGHTKYLIPTGGVKHNVDGRQISECDYMTEILLGLGVPNDVIIAENLARNTKENMIGSMLSICYRFDEIEHLSAITLITSPFHMKRSLELGRLLLPRHITVYGLTTGYENEKNMWHQSADMTQIVENEILYMKRLIDNTKTFDIEF